MNKKLLVFVCIAALLSGAAFYFWGAKTPVPVAVEAQHTDKLTKDIVDTLETVTARIEAQRTKTKTEVRVVYETVRAKVNDLPPDAIVDGLNAELAMFRGLETGTGRLDDN